MSSMAFVAQVPAIRASSSPRLTTSFRSTIRRASPVRRAWLPRDTPRASLAAEKALIFDCDGVIVESEELHRLSYNQCWAVEGLDIEWSYELYEMLQNSVGGGKEKMRWYFKKYGWPDGQPNDSPMLLQKREEMIDRLQTKKTSVYKSFIERGDANAREGVLRLMDEAAERGLKLAICSAATAEAVYLVLDALVGKDRLAKFDVVMAGDVVSKKKPDPMIYNVAREKLGVRVEDCVVIEDSKIGLQAALAAGMKVVITYTPYTKSQQFDGASAIYPGLGGEDGVTVDTLFPELAQKATV